MYPYKRPEMENDPAKLPGQIVNRPDYPQAVYLRDVIARIQREEDLYWPPEPASVVSCCRCTDSTIMCEGCPYAV